MKKYIIAFDLHGTLLDEQWLIKDNDLSDIIFLLESISPLADFYIITGNDETFVKDYLPDKLLKYINGLVLESGSIIKNNSNKTYLINENIISYANELKQYLIKKNFDFIKYFGNREATISLFTKDENGGEDPLLFCDIVRNELKQCNVFEHFYLTFSNVAIDIIPLNISKWNALNHIVEDKTIFSFVDSYNDKDIAENSLYTFLPANSSNKLLDYLHLKNKLIFPLRKFHLIKKSVYISNESYTRAVIDGLKYIKEEVFCDK